ncbi:pentatricopeptide repeat-containing protein At4g19191, mitochondrial [Diospyros lotus]|uniref:pentatricopeptide repeat-containing protein At4g19191, mitochondrial n=1 Tax=Diospyros lotus TaxID=55363 RepID=UPI002256F672|nr:pentatricopeptide repeat-containing protein At4g19191, mitochondrial [Diospyros lotus]XP_052195797.1 pentatricopeptide repeat-containing protein At4g19191, mitochondrial [Diospyros lotus]XP_052195798.1 pentatricopeptide repeat-containing protein At4g19191, mitochondrial [Diospyros lotus]XP_052195799.1 pentatricopeptide repeat-containing protein At4g19191, mitochondrial [Diospyros lotus]XP_052195800.1 pentatricopeptide repeat-containing protein At4g19191, mitochondrial [Diospyros lotus]XP_05
MLCVISSSSSPFSSLSRIAQWNSNIREAVNQGQPGRALILFRQMKQCGLRPNNFTFPLVAKACAKLSSLPYSQALHAQVSKSPFEPDLYVQTALLDMYVKCDRLDCAYNLFQKMPLRDVTSWNAILVGCAQLGFFDKVVALFYQMRVDGVRADSVTVIALAHVSSSIKEIKLVNSIHCFGIRVGVGADVSVANTLIAAYSRCGELGMAEMVFGGIDAGCRTVISWNSMLSGYSCTREPLKAINFYKRMLFDGFSPDVGTICSLLVSCVTIELLYHGKSIHCHGFLLGCDSNTSVLNTLISMYSKCGDIASARCIFDDMTDTTCVSWTAIIGGYAEKGDLDEALVLFHSMEAAGQKPDLVTVLYMISGCGRTGALEVGRWFDNYTLSNGLKDSVMMCNALIDMYAKCGSVRVAWEIFYAMGGRTVVSWTTMIAGYALNGEFKEALDLFFQMLEVGPKPNHVTFLAVLQACNHAGFLEKGWECFHLMAKVHKINPGLDHYSCMVDLLGRKGKLREALEFIHKMPIKPDAGIWGALLGACKNHHNVEIGEYATCHLFELEPQAAAPYVEMANIYASVGRWDGVATIRAMMRGNQVEKYPGQSIVQVNGKSHTFTVEDRSHPEGLLMYEALDALTLQLKEVTDEHLHGLFGEANF